MGYKNITLDLRHRTLEILEQYEACIDASSEKSYEVTLLINCLLALIVLPKEKGVTYLPKKRMTSLSDWGVEKSTFKCRAVTVKDFIYQLRGSVAHLSIDSITDRRGQIEFLTFYDDAGKKELAKFDVLELKSFLKNFYRAWSEAVANGQSEPS